MFFSLYIIFKKDDTDKNWRSNHRKFVSIIASTRIMLLPKQACTRFGCYPLYVQTLWMTLAPSGPISKLSSHFRIPKVMQQKHRLDFGRVLPSA